VIKRIPAWSSNLTTRAISTPKLIVTDSGLGGRLIGMSEERAKDPTAPVGPLLENFAIGEVARQLTWAEEPVQLFHYRDRDQVEVDMVLEHAAGTVIGIEVKAAETVRAEDFRGLRYLANRLGDRFRAGIVLYAGEQQLSFGDRLTALPMAALWTLDRSAPQPRLPARGPRLSENDRSECHGPFSQKEHVDGRGQCVTSGLPRAVGIMADMQVADVRELIDGLRWDRRRHPYRGRREYSQRARAVAAAVADMIEAGDAASAGPLARRAVERVTVTCHTLVRT
jgi:hypothetical protein